MCLWFSTMIHSWCLLIPVVFIWKWDFRRVGCKVNKHFMQMNSWDECHNPWFTVWTSMGLYADMEVCMIFMKQEARWLDPSGRSTTQHFWHFFGKRISVASRGRDWWFSGVALYHVPTWSTSPLLHEGERWGFWLLNRRCCKSCLYIFVL